MDKLENSALNGACHLKITANAEDLKKPATGAAISPDEVRALQAQIIATFIGLPRTCVKKRCRRNGRCLADSAPCLRQHWGLAQDRIAGLVWEESS